jgi:hypothetical protein
MGSGSALEPSGLSGHLPQHTFAFLRERPVKSRGARTERLGQISDATNSAVPPGGIRSRRQV